MKSLLRIFPAMISVAVCTGCYTQFVMIDKTPPQPTETVEWVVDSTTGDTVKVIKQVDTIKVDDRQTCVWERDLMGYPILRCYDSFYPRDWFWYNNSPWWYRNDPYWYDYNRCPRFYYYDPSCGCCRYTGSSYYHQDHHSNPYHDRDERTSSGGSTIPPRVRGVPSENAKQEVPKSATPSTGSTNASTRSSGSIIIESGSDGNQSRSSQRTRGVPESGASTVTPSTPAPAQTQGATSNVSQPAPVNQTPATSTSSTKKSTSQSQQNDSSNNSRRRHPRSW